MKLNTYFGVRHWCFIWEVRQENQEFKVILSYIASLRSAWATKHEILSQKKTTTKMQTFTREEHEDSWVIFSHLHKHWLSKVIRHWIFSCPSFITLLPTNDLTLYWHSVQTSLSSSEPAAKHLPRHWSSSLDQQFSFSCQTMEPRCRPCLFIKY